MGGYVHVCMHVCAWTCVHTGRVVKAGHADVLCAQCLFVLYECVYTCTIILLFVCYASPYVHILMSCQACRIESRT